MDAKELYDFFEDNEDSIYASTDASVEANDKDGDIYDKEAGGYCHWD